jgi:nucleoid DNA-binding protein|tara:strand:+ start:3432 stop:3662 length:231 start_codon:yes stop_codon:yes gene_type:complete
MPKSKREIIQHLATKYNLPLSKIEQMVDHQFKVVSDVMTQGKFSTVRIPYFGKFSVNPNRVKHIDRLKNEKGKRKD